MKQMLRAIFGASLLACAVASPIVALAEAVTSTAVSVSPVTLYVLPNCSYCARARGLLNEQNVVFEERNIEDPQVNAEWKALGGRGVPLLKVGEQLVQGFDPARMQAALESATR